MKSQLEINKILIEAIKKDFNNSEELKEAFDIDLYERLSLTEVKEVPELKHFFGLDEEGPYMEFLKKGLKSLRKGFYKLCSPPTENISIFPSTFCADVYYFNTELNSNKFIKYRANVGPMINTHFDYVPLIGTHQYTNVNKIPVLKTFIEERSNSSSPHNNYYYPKKNFFTALNNSGKMFYVQESEFDKAFPDTNPKPKKVTWSFLDF